MADAGEGEIRRADDIGKGQGLKPRQIVALVLLGLLILLAVLNLEKVSVDLLFGSVSMPLVLLIAVCAGAGFLIGWLVRGRRERRERRGDGE